MFARKKKVSAQTRRDTQQCCSTSKSPSPANLKPLRRSCHRGIVSLKLHRSASFKSSGVSTTPTRAPFAKCDLNLLQQTVLLLLCCNAPGSTRGVTLSRCRSASGCPNSRSQVPALHCSRSKRLAGSEAMTVTVGRFGVNPSILSKYKLLLPSGTCRPRCSLSA